LTLGKNNIEDIFREGLSEFNVQPSGKVWSGINKKLIGPRLESLYRTAFNGYKISPSEQVWRRIAAGVWFNKFIHFTPFSFNIYYAGFIITAAIGTVVTINNPPDLSFVHFEDKTIVVESEPVIDETIETPDIFEAENLAVLNSQISNVENVELKDPVVNTIRTVIPQNQILVSETEKEAETEIFETIIEAENKETFEKKNVFEFLDFKKLKLLASANLKYSPLWNEIADSKFNNVEPLDVIVYDTIGYNYLGEPIVIEKSFFSFDLGYTPYLHSYSFVLSNPELLENYKLYSENINPCLSHAYSLGLAYNYNNFRIESGLSYFSLNDNLSQTVQIFDTVTKYYYNYFDTEILHLDTTMILDLDQYLLGNIVYIPYVDSSFITVLDSTQMPYLDTVLTDKNLISASTYHFIDIPIIVGYQFNYGNFAITPKAGIITGVLVKRGGNCYNVMDGQIHNSDLLPNNKFIFDYYSAINLQYKTGKHVSLFVEPHFRGNLNSLYQKNYAISQKSRKFGLKTGVSIRF
jgi:hypothetical protein